MKESGSPIRINLKRFALLLGLGFVALLLSLLPKEKKATDASGYTLRDNTGDSALIPTARADDIGIISLTGSGIGGGGSSGGGK